MKLSIRLRLVLILVGLMALTWAIEAAMTRSSAEAEITALFDAQLAQVAQMLAITVAHEAREHDLEGYREAILEPEYAYPAAFQVWSRDGRLLFHSPDAPHARLPHQDDGYADVVLNGIAWHVLGVVLEEGHLILVGHRIAERDALISKIGGDVIRPLALSLALAIVLIWFGVQGGLTPLRRLAREVARRDEGSLEPLPAASYPVEVRALADELNRMFVRLDEALERYGRFTSDAAHELRTPLAGLRIQAQAALRAEDPDEQLRALKQLVTGVDRTTRIVDQLLTLARIDPAGRQLNFTTVDLDPVTTDATVECASFASKKGIRLRQHNHRGASEVRGNRELLRILCRNLLDNAVRYTPPGGTVDMCLETASNRIELIVEDSGPGIPADERAAVLERFHRLPGTGGTGSGLGLPIVETVCRLHEATLTLTERANGPGLRAVVSFPAGI